MKICMAQIDTTVGDFRGNSRKILQYVDRAKYAEAELVVFPEMALTSYPPRDLLLRESFIDAQLDALAETAAQIKDIAAIIGFVSKNESGEGKRLRNSAAVIIDGRIVDIRHKRLLPTYDVFDEQRYFEPTEENEPLEIFGGRIGLTICEDAWAPWRGLGMPTYTMDPVRALAEKGARLIINISASPFTTGKSQVRHKLLSDHARSCAIPVVYVNQVGGNDELVFDGESRVYGSDGEALATCKAFEEDMLVIDTDDLPSALNKLDYDEIGSIRKAVALGTRDFVRKCGFLEVVLGLSGGIDSSVVLALAAEALGPANVNAIFMPSVYSSQDSADDSKKLAKNLGVNFETIPITPVQNALGDMMANHLIDGKASDIAQQNIQARLRGLILMALSNRYGWLLLATGNKSELATGYCTLYGDMCGGLAPIGDVLKTQVYALARHINRNGEIIPERVITRPPSAELKPNQTDQDSLPPYDTLDRILEEYIEQEKGIEEIIAMGHDRKLVAEVIRMVDGAEHKRRQAAPCLKVTSRAFGHGRRLPIAKKMQL